MLCFKEIMWTCVDEENGLIDWLDNVFVFDGKEPTVQNDSDFESRIFGQTEQRRRAAKRMTCKMKHFKECVYKITELKYMYA